MKQSNSPQSMRDVLREVPGQPSFVSLPLLAEFFNFDLDAMPLVVKILLENVARRAELGDATWDDVRLVATWTPKSGRHDQFPFLPSRVILQDFTGVPAIVDLAAMRDAAVRLGQVPALINPLIRADLVIDHSVQVDSFGAPDSVATNVALEYERNHERYELLKWAQQAFHGFRVVPPGTGIVHQINLEYLADVVHLESSTRGFDTYFDTLVGTDSHTTMINGLSVLGWGVGGIEAEAALLGQPQYLLTPRVVGCHFHGRLSPLVTATDLVLTVTQLLRRRGVVGSFVEFYGDGLASLSLADRATIANMAPEYGATAGQFPIDAETLRYLALTGRSQSHIDMVSAYAQAQGVFRVPGKLHASYDDIVELDLATVVPSVAGPRRPQDRVDLDQVPESFSLAYPSTISPVSLPERPNNSLLKHGDVAIAAITSCTNTSNPSVMIAAGLLARNAVNRGLQVNSYVKTSLAPGSRVVTDYLEKAGLLSSLEALGFNVVGYGCTTCIGNSGPLSEPVSESIRENDLVVTAVLSGNRNFEGRIHPSVKSSYLASPPLVVAYALAGSVAIDLTKDPIGHDMNGAPVYLHDIWPSPDDIEALVEDSVLPEMFQSKYAHVFDGDEKWASLSIPSGQVYDWKATSTYIQAPPFLQDISAIAPTIEPILGARALVILGDSVTTDHISPAGAIPPSSPAGQYLLSEGVAVADFNSYGARRGNHQVMIRGTFGNIRLRNEMAQGKEGDWTTHEPSGELLRIYQASQRYSADSIPLVVIAGKEYGSGSSRDWAAKGTFLLGVRMVIAESYERIHRSNLVGMGVLPLEFLPGTSRTSLGLTGHEIFSIPHLDDELISGATLSVEIRRRDGSVEQCHVLCRIDSPGELEYYRHGGILPYVVRQFK